MRYIMTRLVVAPASIFGFVALVLAVNPPGVIDRPRADQLPAIKELPDPFVMNDGSRVKSKQDWAKRREELKELIQYYEYGHLPPAPGNVTASASGAKINAQTSATERQILLTMGPEGKVSTHLELTIPAGDGPFAVIITGDLGWGKVKEPIAKEVLGRKYVLAEFNRTEIAAD